MNSFDLHKIFYDKYGAKMNLKFEKTILERASQNLVDIDRFPRLIKISLAAQICSDCLDGLEKQ